MPYQLDELISIYETLCSKKRDSGKILINTQNIENNEIDIDIDYSR